MESINGMSEVDVGFEEWKKRLNQQCFMSLGLDTEGLPDREWQSAYLRGLSPVKAIEEQLDCDLNDLNIDKLLDELF